MNAIIDAANTHDIAPVASRPRRKTALVGNPAPDALDRFNATLGQFGRVPMTLEELAASAHRLAPVGGTAQASDWIVRRMRRALTIGLMLADPCWEPSGRCGEVAGIVLAYLRSTDDLIPDETPRIGHLDDALVVEAAWPLLADEIRDYLEFGRIRRIEAALRGCAENDFVFTRADWQQARHAEAALVRHRDAVALRSYLPSARTPRFRVC
ncbi:MAG: YkvA family protein [Luteimonas sp.]|nr:YkvA family protein [Luteimonas sp.]